MTSRSYVLKLLKTKMFRWNPLTCAQTKEFYFTNNRQKLFSSAFSKCSVYKNGAKINNNNIEYETQKVLNAPEQECETFFHKKKILNSNNSTYSINMSLRGTPQNRRSSCFILKMEAILLFCEIVLGVSRRVPGNASFTHAEIRWRLVACSPS